jgi:hypothetical protein
MIRECGGLISSRYGNSHGKFEIKFSCVILTADLHQAQIHICGTNLSRDNNNNNSILFQFNSSIQFFIINVPSQQQNANYRNSTV